MRTARAVRRFRPDPVPDDVVLACLEAATWAPSNANLQPWRFCVLRAPEARVLLGRAYRDGWSAYVDHFGVTADDLVGDGRRARLNRSMKALSDGFADVPVYVLCCVQPQPGESPFDTAASIFPAIQNFSLAARAHGLGTVLTTWYRSVEPELRELVGVPEDWLLAALLPVGYPVGGVGPVRRRPVDSVVGWDAWD
jgi:nitroreductase